MGVSSGCRGAFGPRHVREQGDIRGARVLPQEDVHGVEGAVASLEEGDLFLGVGLDGVAVDLREDRGHDGHGQKEREAHHDLVRGQLLGAHGLLHEGEDHEDPREGGHGQDDGRQQGQDRHDEDDLDPQGQVLAVEEAPSCREAPRPPRVWPVHRSRHRSRCRHRPRIGPRRRPVRPSVPGRTRDRARPRRTECRRKRPSAT